MKPKEQIQRLERTARPYLDESPNETVGPQGDALILELQRLRHAFDDEEGSNQQRRGSSRERIEAERLRRNGPPKRRRKSKMGKALDICLEQIGLKAPAPVERRGGRSKGEAPRGQPSRSAPAKNGSIKHGSKNGAPKGGSSNRKRPRSDALASDPFTIDSFRSDAFKSDSFLNDMLKSEPLKNGTLKSGPSRNEPLRNGPSRTAPPVEPRVSPLRRASPPIVPDDGIATDLAKLAPDITRPAASSQSMFPQGPRLALPPATTALSNPAAEIPSGKRVDRWRAGLTAGISFITDRGAPAPPVDDGLVVGTRWSFERELRTGLRILIVAAVLGGGWLAFVPLAGAVVVPGNLVVQSNVKQIQHPTGGVVAEIKVQNGSRVSAGDLLVRLDATQAQANLQVVTKQLDEIRARIARLSAERDGLADITFPAELAARAGDDEVKSLLASEESLFKARAGARQSQKDLLQSQAEQLAQQIGGFESQLDAKAKQLDLIHGELTGVQDLYDKHLVPLTRLTSLQRDAAQIDGERGQMTSSIAETKSKIDSSQLQIVRIDQDFRSEVVKDLNEAQAKEAELAEHGIAARDQLDRIEIHSPTSGFVNQLSLHTIGGVIKAGETIMEIVPDADDLQVEAHVQPKDIDHVHTGQTAFVRFSAFNQRTTPQLNGTVSYVSADTGQDQQTHSPTYTVRVVLPEEERRRLNGAQLVPGMPAEVFMQTGSRTMMHYLFEPILDQLRRAFVEQ
ncbi:HlyD family type I secretion periplasmic adaptor subunit [Bradyrhizobium sp.]|uniref:HlyD family type I secretion periplasmic adaptor subunit n=1 Tax=Bradyrhizobium sp. TaxID=376 RepID=UPI003C608F64